MEQPVAFAVGLTSILDRWQLFYTVLLKVYHPTFSDNFNSNCPILVIFGTVIRPTQ